MSDTSLTTNEINFILKCYQFQKTNHLEQDYLVTVNLEDDDRLKSYLQDTKNVVQNKYDEKGNIVYDDQGNIVYTFRDDGLNYILEDLSKNKSDKLKLYIQLYQDDIIDKDTGRVNINKSDFYTNDSFKQFIRNVMSKGKCDFKGNIDHNKNREYPLLDQKVITEFVIPYNHSEFWSYIKKNGKELIASTGKMTELENQKTKLETQIETITEQFNRLTGTTIKNITIKRELNDEITKLKNELEIINIKLNRGGGLIRKRSWRRKKHYKNKNTWRNTPRRKTSKRSGLKLLTRRTYRSR